MKNYLCILVVALPLLFSSCAPGSGDFGKENPAGFLSGVWHGWIAPVTLIVGFFDNKIRVYETNNTGWWYDFGFYIAIVGGFGGISLTRKNFQRSKS
jgi:hypothetical protein